MTESSPLDRAKENATEIASTVVTGVWLAAFFLGAEWWLPLMLFCYVVVVPVVELLFGDEEEPDERADGETHTGTERDPVERDTREGSPGEGNADALDRLRTRYADGDLTDEQFERKLDKLLETETPEDAEEWRERERERTLDRERS